MERVGPVLVLDADWDHCLLAEAPDTRAVCGSRSFRRGLVLTPHEGEFGRYFPTSMPTTVPSKVEPRAQGPADAPMASWC